MERKNIIKLCVVTIVGLLCCLAVYMVRLTQKTYIPVESDMQYMGVTIVPDTEFLEGKRKLVLKENPGVYFEDTLLPYSRYNTTLYLSQSYDEEEWVGELSAMDGAFLCAPMDEYWDYKRNAILDGHEFVLWLVTEDVYYEMSLVVSGMPVISMNYDLMERQQIDYAEDPDAYIFDSEDLYFGDIQVFNPGVGTEQYEITDCGVRYFYRGNLSGGYDKPSFSISLLDDREENLDVPLLGMRSDNSWKLITLITDPNRVREKTASQIWEYFAEANTEVNEAGPRMEYVELVLNNEYQGLYCLVEPVDEKKLELDEDDYLYKIIGQGVATDAEIQEAVDQEWKRQGAIRIRYPEIITDYAAAWEPLREYQNTFYFDEESGKALSELAYLENAYDMYMFLMTVSAADNNYKNMYYAADVETDGSYKLRQIPWDLDYTFGNIHDASIHYYSSFNPDETVVYAEMSADNLVADDPTTAQALLTDRWYSYRESFLSTMNIEQLFLENMDYLLTSGAIQRENSRWPQYAVSGDLTELLEYQNRRMEWLDVYFGELYE